MKLGIIAEDDSDVVVIKELTLTDEAEKNRL